MRLPLRFNNPKAWIERRFCRAMLSFSGVLLSGIASLAAPVQYQVDSWTTENGLPQNVIRDVCQAPDGYLWLATMDGLVRFDGLRFVVFNRSNTAGIAGNRFTSLLCLADGDIWAGTETSGLTRDHRGLFETYTTSDGLPWNEVYGVVGDNAGQVWALARTSIASWNSKTSRFQRLTGGDAGYRYFGDRGFGFWATDDDHILLFKLGKFYRYSLPSDWPRGSLKSFGEDIGGNLFVASKQGKFAKLESGDRFAPIPGTQKQDAKPAESFYQSQYRDRDGQLWRIDTRYDKGGFLVQSLIVPTAGRREAIEFNDLLEDREGSVWLATDGHGLYRVRRQTVSVLSVGEGLPDRNIYPIFQDHSDNIWIGTWSGGLARYKDGRVGTYNRAQGLSSDRINAIYEDRVGTLWVSSYPNVYRFVHDRFEEVTNTLLKEREGTRVIFQDDDGTMWFGTGQGLVRFKAGGWRVITSKEGLAADDVRVIVQARTGGIWVGGYGGLTRFFSDGTLKRWTERDGLPSMT